MKVIFTLITICLLFSCSKDDAPKEEQELWMNGYTVFTPTSDYEVSSVKFIFFSANKGEEFFIESKAFDGTISEYQSLQDETFSLLSDNKIKSKSGSVISAFDSKFVSGESGKYGTITLPIGRYYLCAIYQGQKDGYKWLYSTKYTGKYIDVTEQYNPMAISVVFPCDRNRYGYTKWVSWNEKFDYDFNF